MTDSSLENSPPAHTGNRFSTKYSNKLKYSRGRTNAQPVAPFSRPDGGSAPAAAAAAAAAGAAAGAARGAADHKAPTLRVRDIIHGDAAEEGRRDQVDDEAHAARFDCQVVGFWFAGEGKPVLKAVAPPGGEEDAQRGVRPAALV